MSDLARRALSALVLAIVPLLLSTNVAALPHSGVRVDSISAVSSGSTWEVLDYQHVVVTLDTQQRYLLTLSHMCPKLAVAAKLGISTSGDAVYAGFDYITADGERCLIKDISRLRA